MRTCKRCGAEKSLGDFHRRPECRGGYSPVCRECINAPKRRPRKVGRRVDLEKYKRCNICNEVKRRWVDFYIANDYPESWCRDCGRIKIRARDRARCDVMAELKLMIGCYDCGYRGDSRKLEWDHLPGHVKLFKIGSGNCHSIEAVDAEIKKCQLVCQWCHRRRSVERGQLSTFHNRKSLKRKA